MPTEENAGLPIFLSSFSLTLLGVLAAFLLLAPATIRENQLAQLLGGPTFAKTDVIRLVNSARVNAGLPSLKENEVLDIAAAAKAEDMASKEYFSHNSPDGKTPWDFIKGAGYKYTAAGENLAMDFTTAEAAENALMASPTHRANILNPLYTEIGVSVVRGTFESRPAIYLVQHFGKPSVKVSQLPPIKDLTAAKEILKLPVQKIETPTTTAKTAVLGTEIKPQAVNQAGSPATDIPDVPIRFLGFFVTFMLLTTLAIALIRLGALPFGVMIKTFVLILIFGYIATHSAILKEAAQITPVSFSTNAISVAR
ncbi:MAG: spore coat assembly protein SafA [Parcubacteria group bacterium LiPW_15]|nr:MAG: spore coat assembly protein SafA [Parcubacteria group bacterium LiPW_15]